MKTTSGHSASVVIVTHNSADCIHHCIEALTAQYVKPACIIIVDSGSDDKAYLDRYREQKGFKVIEEDNIGYGAANNIGLAHIDQESDYFLILNPDTFLLPSFLEQALELSEKIADAAIVTGILEAYDLQRNRPSGRIDSTGIYRSWYGKWYDRGQGKEVSSYDVPEKGFIPATCGALMFCRRSFFDDELPNLFDERFFLYKEDIELGLRVRKQGGKIYFSPSLTAYHCRGWDRTRRKVTRANRLMSSYNEMLLYRIHPSPYIIWAAVKYAMVRIFNL